MHIQTKFSSYKEHQPSQAFRASAKTDFGYFNMSTPLIDDVLCTKKHIHTHVSDKRRVRGDSAHFQKFLDIISVLAQ